MLALALGHSLTVKPRGSSYIAVCTCAYSSTNRRTERLAVEAALHHQKVIIVRWQASGSPMPTALMEKPAALG